jgi:methylthioribose-1-phosphate isomerase
MLEFKENTIILIHGVLTPGALAKIKHKGGARIVICEGRPSLRAAEHNSRYFLDKKVTPIIICDNMAGFLFSKNYVKEVVIACQYADSSGALCDMGALILAVLAKKHKVSVRLLEAEHKKHFLGNPKDLLTLKGQATASAKTHAYAPSVEWVPAKYIK